jgi:hypothetical protein
VIEPNKIRFEPTQETFDQEIVAAHRGGLKYWAYLMYGEDSKIDLGNSMMKGLVFHRGSAIKSQMNYAMMVTVDTLGYVDNYKDAVGAILTLMRDSNYQTVLGGRPVLYLYYVESLLASHWRGSINNLATSLNALRDEALGAGLANPYIILMSGPPVSAESVRVALGADAISAYAITLPSNTTAPYSQLARFTQQIWEKEAAASSAGVVPTVMIGWDTRPRKENPPAYDHSDHSHTDVVAHITAPTPLEFAQACRGAVDFIHAHSDRCASRLALIYAWNEDSEGGPLEPTLGDQNASKLVAASSVIN